MHFEDEILVKEYVNMMTDMIVLCFTLAISLSLWIISITASTYYGKLISSHQSSVLNTLGTEVVAFSVVMCVAVEIKNVCYIWLSLICFRHITACLSMEVAVLCSGPSNSHLSCFKEKESRPWRCSGR